MELETTIASEAVMNKLYQTHPLASPADFLLADVTVRIQLSETNHRVAVERFERIVEWVDRPESPLHGYVVSAYAQGSMAIGATISSKLDSDEFDIDGMLEISLPAMTDPGLVLDLLFLAIRGERGSRYYDMTERRTRCVTIKYADMHIDVTPAVRDPLREARTSWIFHDKPEDPLEPSLRLYANPWGLADRYKEQTPLDHRFAEAFAARTQMLPGYEVLAEAQAEPTPDQVSPARKSKALVVHQLTKRWRNIQYDQREGRRPPSVLLAKINGDAAGHTITLSEELEYQAQYLWEVFAIADREGRLVHVENPRCTDDVLTDRWPGDHQTQKVFLRDLVAFNQKISRLRAPDCSLEEMQELMIELFGERPARAAVDAFNEAVGTAVQEGRIVRNSSGGIDLAASGIVASAGVAATPAPLVHTTPKHTFYGSAWVPR